MLHTRLRQVGLPLLAALLLAGPAVAQETEDTRATDGEKKTVVIEIEDGQRRVFVDGEELTGAEAEAFLQKWKEEEGAIKGRYRMRIPSGEHDVVVSGEAPNVFHFKNRLGPLHERMKYGDAEIAFRDGALWMEHLGELGGLMGHGSMKGRAEIARMEAESRRLAHEVLEAEGAERTRLENELREKLNEIFARKQALRAEHMDELREKLNALETEHSERAAAQREIVERRLKTLLGERDKYDW